MSDLGRRYKEFFSRPAHLSASISGFLLLLTSLVVNHLAVNYAVRNASNSAADLILSHIPIFDVDGLFVYGGLAMVVFIAAATLPKPESIPFLLKTIALFVMIRSLFVTLTHLAPVPDHVPLAPDNPMRWFTSGADLFFSGHTGLPFLIALIFWERTAVRSFFIFLSFFFAAIVLLGHLHYSIDVFAAFFITHSVFHVAEIFFAYDRRLQHANAT